jgi:hypothetical protein
MPAVAIRTNFDPRSKEKPPKKKKSLIESEQSDIRSLMNKQLEDGLMQLMKKARTVPDTGGLILDITKLLYIVRSGPISPIRKPKKA